jgi:two-component system sensor histidine kinase TrcS
VSESHRTIRGRAPWTLRTQLVTGVAVIVAGVFVATVMVSIAGLNGSVTTVIDSQLRGSLDALNHSLDKFRYGGAYTTGQATSTPAPSPGEALPPLKSPKAFVDYVGHGPGSIIALIGDGVVVDSAVFSDSDATVLNRDDIAVLENATIAPGSYQDLELADLGRYRLASNLDSRGNLMIVGIPMTTADAAVVRETLTILILGILALTVIIGGVILMVRFALKPLDRVVSTAAAVTALPLERSEVGISTRVAEADTDPRTEIGKVGEALNRLLSHVDDALAVRAASDRRMRRFVTDASHELRTPLAAIQGYAELTRQENDALPDLAEFSLARIESESKRMNSLVSELLLLARLDEGQDLHVDEIDLAEIVINAVSDATAISTSHRLTVSVPDEPAIISADPERMHQLVANLISNAIMHTPAGSRITATVKTGASPQGGLSPCIGEDPGSGAVVELLVSDNGPGIAEDLLPDLFERFARGDSSRSRSSGSTGLGLAIVAAIVEAHNGSIRVASSPEGTSFIITVRAA